MSGGGELCLVAATLAAVRAAMHTLDKSSVSCSAIEAALPSQIRLSEAHRGGCFSARLWASGSGEALTCIAQLWAYNKDGRFQRADFWLADNLITLEHLHDAWGAHVSFLGGHAPYGQHLSETRFCPKPDLFCWVIPDCPQVLVLAARPLGQTGVPLIALHATASIMDHDLTEDSTGIAWLMPTFSYSPPNPPWYPLSNRDEEEAARKAWVIQRAADHLVESFARLQADVLHLIPFRGRYHALWRSNRRVVEEVSQASFVLGNYLDARAFDNQKGILSAVLKKSGLPSEFSALPGVHGTRFVIFSKEGTAEDREMSPTPDGDADDWVVAALHGAPMVIETADGAKLARFSTSAWNAGLTVAVISRQPLPGTEDAHCLPVDELADAAESLVSRVLQSDFDVLVRYVGSEDFGAWVDRYNTHLREQFCCACIQFFVAERVARQPVACPLCAANEYPTIRDTSISNSDYFILSDTGMPERMFLLSNKLWYFDNGRDVAIYDMSPLRKDARRLNVSATDWGRGVPCR